MAAGGPAAAAGHHGLRLYGGFAVAACDASAGHCEGSHSSPDEDSGDSKVETKRLKDSTDTLLDLES